MKELKKYIAVTIFSLAVLILSICARNFDISNSVTDTENNVSNVNIVSI